MNLNFLIKYFFRYIWHLPRSMFFCLHYFPIKEAIKIPILLSNRVKLHTLRGKIIIKSDKIIPFMIKIGFGDVGIFDKYYIRSIWQNEGEVIFMGKASIGHGSKLSIGKNGLLVLGDNFKITSNSSIICTKKISIGMGCHDFMGCSHYGY